MSAPSEEDLPLAAEFSPATREQWLALVDGVLKGARFEERLVSETYDRLRIEPLHARAARAQPVAVRASRGAWQVMQRVDHPDPAAANAQALRDLEGGATGLVLVCAGAVGAYGYGLDPSPATFERALAGVHLDAGITLELDCGMDAAEAADAVLYVVGRHGHDPASITIRFGFDPLGAMAVRGSAYLPWTDIAPTFAAGIAACARHRLPGPFAVADARPVHAAGGSEAQELAWALASAAAYLRALDTHGVALDAARRMIGFRLAADADQFLTIAKFRALRRLWARVEAACGLDPAPAFVTAETAWRMLTRRDPHVNMLRATIAALAAGISGADAISVLPFTAALGLPDRFARRIARNTQLILMEESSLAKVADPAAGAGAFEDLTEKLCHAAWTLFQEIESRGGAYAALQSGLIQSKVATVRAARETAVAHRRDAITGTSEFPQLEEARVTVLDARPPTVRHRGVAVSFAPLQPLRLAAPFEALRDASDRALDATGARPKLFLANLGRPADFTPRATFAKNLFEAGGIETIGNDGFAGKDAMIAAFRSSGAKLACLCAADEVYAQDGSAAAALAASGAVRVYLAGRPRALPQADHAAITAFVHVGCDALAILKAAHRTLGLA